MKTLLFAIALAMLLPGIVQSQQQGRLGAGFVVGDPTGIAWKYYTSPRNALSGSIGLSPYDRFRMDVTYLWHDRPFNERNLGLHYGVGGAFGFGRSGYVVYSGRNAYFFRDRDIGFGVRGVIGLNYFIPKSPLDVFFELAPLVVLTPDAGSGIDAGLGMRVYF